MILFSGLVDSPFLIGYLLVALVSGIKARPRRGEKSMFSPRHFLEGVVVQQKMTVIDGSKKPPPKVHAGLGRSRRKLKSISDVIAEKARIYHAFADGRIDGESAKTADGMLESLARVMKSNREMEIKDLEIARYADLIAKLDEIDAN